jgi:hypothetical protein
MDQNQASSWISVKVRLSSVRPEPWASSRRARLSEHWRFFFNLGGEFAFERTREPSYFVYEPLRLCRFGDRARDCRPSGSSNSSSAGAVNFGSFRFIFF